MALFCLAMALTSPSQAQRTSALFAHPIPAQ